MNASATRFFADIPVFDDFSKVIDDSVYRPMPDDWFIGLADVAESTKEIEDGKYKSVNMAGLASISAVINVPSHQNFPFVFGGDGVNFAVLAQEALARTAR